MIRKLVAAASALAVACVGLVALSASNAGAGSVTITAGKGSNVTCDLTGSVKLSPALKNDWLQSQHTTDPDLHVRALGNQTFAAFGTDTSTTKGSTTSCSGTVTDGTHTASVAAAKFTLATDPAHPGSSAELSCANLLSPPMGGTPAGYISNLKWTSGTPGFKIAPTVVTDSTIAASGLGFKTSGGTITGSFGGGTSTSQGNIDSTTISALLQAPPTSTSPVPAFPQCQPTLKIKTNSKGETVSLTAPKGLKKIGIIGPSSTLTFTDP